MNNTKLVEALSTEYEAVYLIDLKKDTYESIKVFNGSTAMLSSIRWSEAAKKFIKECSDDSKYLINMFSNPQYFKTVLMKDDSLEFMFKHIATDSKLRKVSVNVIERENNFPTLVLMKVSLVNNIAYQKEKMLHKILSEDSHDNDEMSVYKMYFTNKTEENSHKQFDGMKILLVEDNALLRQISRDTLENEGAIVTEAEDGQKAVDTILNGYKFDFIIMDIIMPVMDGITATQKITEYQKNDNIKVPILGLTADASNEQMKNIMDAGAYACLSKPLNPKEMAKIFLSYMKEKSMLMEEKMAEINFLANTDMLTQAGNIVSYTHDIDDLTKEINDTNNNVAIVICDLDNLKGINDSYGHDVGDIYIKNCCKLIRDSFQNSKLYRVGGDEFALIVKDNDLLEIDKLIKNLNDKSRIFSSINDVLNGKASVSAGYAIYDSEIDQSLSDTMKRADMEMYENKQLHRKWNKAYSILN